jgi:tetratricopeptide (TPR) repeat protein
MDALMALAHSPIPRLLEIRPISRFLRPLGLRSISLCLYLLSAKAQFLPGKLTFALPEHPGRMSLDQGSWKVVEFSAKSNGNEWGERAEQGKQNMLAFLFAAPDKAPLTATRCRDGMLASEHAEPAIQARSSMRSTSGADIAMAVLVSPKDARMSLRAFVASGDLCGDIAFSAADVKPGDEDAYRETMEIAKKTLLSLTFEPAVQPTFQDIFVYAEVEYRKRQYAGAAVAYRSALAKVEQSGDPQKFRRVLTDQLSMSLGLSGDLKGSREVNEAAIKKDPEYPLYYYNLACADAEAGNARAAQEHLQQAYDRRAHILSEETFPDPTADDSLQKLQGDAAFWGLAQRIAKEVRSDNK